MIVLGTNTRCIFMTMTWKPWRMYSGRKWRIEEFTVSGGHSAPRDGAHEEAAHAEACQARSDARWQSRFPQGRGPFTELLGKSFVSCSARASPLLYLCLSSHLKGPTPSWHHLCSSPSPSRPSGRVRRLEGSAHLCLVSEELLVGSQWAITLLHEFL